MHKSLTIDLVTMAANCIYLISACYIEVADTKAHCNKEQKLKEGRREKRKSIVTMNNETVE